MPLTIVVAVGIAAGCVGGTHQASAIEQEAFTFALGGGLPGLRIGVPGCGSTQDQILVLFLSG